MSGHACNARCDRGGHFMLAEYQPKHLRVCETPYPRGVTPCVSCEQYAADAHPGYQPRHRAEVTP